MTDIEKLRARSITKLDSDAALQHIGNLIDASDDMKFAQGVDRALYLLEELSKRTLSNSNWVVLDYFRANAWDTKDRLSIEHDPWSWNNTNREQQILALSRATAHPGFSEIDAVRRCQILTNKANALNATGRFIDAIEVWDAALCAIPNFAMAQANRGHGLRYYCDLLNDDFDRAIFLLHAYESLKSACSPDAIYDSGNPEKLQERFADAYKKIAEKTDLDYIREIKNQGRLSLGRSRAERMYRQWCLDQRLFLNPLNDLGLHSEAASDSLILPPISEPFNERRRTASPPLIVGFFNQLKQEYVSARFMLYEGIHSTKFHFSDRKVHLSDTLDYPSHSLAIERVRSSFRITYSLLDKIAFFVNHYWKLNKNPERISFKNVWMIEDKSRLLSQLERYTNWPLRGLYWISKELFDPQLKETTSADARELHDIRNGLEHKYVKVQEGWALPFTTRSGNNHTVHPIISSDLLEAKALRLAKIARSAVIKLSLAVGVEERARSNTKPDGITIDMPLYKIGERRKRRTYL